MARTASVQRAVARYLDPFRTALRCIAHGTLVTTIERTYVVGREHSLVINNGLPLQLRANPFIALSGGQVFRIEHNDRPQRGGYRVHAVKYFYVLSTDDRRELLNFQWTPHAMHPGEKTFPHLHVGRGLLGDNAPVFPETFHKKHVPTGHISFTSIIRFTIEELGVPPVRPDWSGVLDRGEALA